MSLSKKSKIGIVILLSLIVGGVIVYNQLYKTHKTANDLEIGFSGTAIGFIDTVKTGSSILENAAVQLTGHVTNSTANSITINNSIYCILDTNAKLTTNLQGQEVTIKARYIGYDDLLEEIKLDKTIILK